MGTPFTLGKRHRNWVQNVAKLGAARFSPTQRTAVQEYGVRGSGAGLLHRRLVLQLYSESRRAVARLYHPDDHDCLVLTGPVT